MRSMWGFPPPYSEGSSTMELEMAAVRRALFFPGEADIRMDALDGIDRVFSGTRGNFDGCVTCSLSLSLSYLDSMHIYPA